MSLRALRTIWFALLAAVVLWLSSRAPWLAELHHGGCGYLLELGRAPVWNPPPEPSFARFAETFRQTLEFPRFATVADDVRVAVMGDHFCGELLLGCSLPCALCGLWYWAVRGRRVDLVLHGALGVAVGVAAGAVGSIGLWFLLGGWGPPLLQFGLSGFVLGGLTGVLRGASLRATTPLPEPGRSATIRRWPC